MLINNLFEGDDKDPCWKGYRQLGMKDKNGKQVPNCVPESQTTNEAEHRFDEPLTGWHIVYRGSGNPVHGTPSFESKDEAQKYLMTKMFANHQEFKVVHTAQVGMGETKENNMKESDISGLMHAAKHLDKSFIITAKTTEGVKKTFRVRAQSERTAKEKFSKHYAQAEILSVKEEGVTEGYWQDVIKKVEADREARKGKPFKKNPLSHDKGGVYKGDKDLAGNPVPTRKEQSVTEGDFDQWGGEIKTPTGEKQKYKITLPDGKVKKFVASNDREAKSIAKDYDGKNLIKLKSDISAEPAKDQGVAEATGDAKFDSMMSNITKKKMAVDRRTGQEYDPEEEFDKALKRHQAQFKGMAAVEKAQKKDVAEDLSERDQKDVNAIKAAIERLQAQLKHPDANKEAIQQSIAHEKKRLALYGQGVAEDQATNPTDKITCDVPLLIRLLEYAREDAKTDMDLHNVTERLIALSAEGRTLSMQDYDAIVGSANNSMQEAKGLSKRVKVVSGPHSGKTGWIREVKHGAFKGAQKTYFVDLDDGGQANNLTSKDLRLVKDVQESTLYPGEAHVYSVTFDDGTTANIEDPYDRGISDTVAKKYPGKKVTHIEYKGISGMGLSGGNHDTSATQKYQQQQRDIETQKQFARAERNYERGNK